MLDGSVTILGELILIQQHAQGYPSTWISLDQLRLAVVLNTTLDADLGTAEYKLIFVFWISRFKADNARLGAPQFSRRRSFP